MISFVLLQAQEIEHRKQQLEDTCLYCHNKQQIPSELIYRRYLMQYSTHKNITKAMYKYLKNPKKENSIMPSQFFLKFPMKEELCLDDETLQKNIRTFLQTFDVKKKLILP